MTSPNAKPRFATIPALLFAVGLGLTFYYGDLWYRLPGYSSAEIEQSVDLNLALDQRRRGQRIDDAQLQTQRDAIRVEIMASIAAEQRSVQLGTLTGAILAAVGLAQMLILRRMAAR